MISKLSFIWLLPFKSSLHSPILSSALQPQAHPAVTFILFWFSSCRLILILNLINSGIDYFQFSWSEILHQNKMENGENFNLNPILNKQILLWASWLKILSLFKQRIETLMKMYDKYKIWQIKRPILLDCKMIPQDPTIFDVFVFLFFSLYGSPSAH